MMMVATFTQYTSTRKFSQTLPAWMSIEDGERINAYLTYETIYRNVPETFKLVLRGSEDKPIYVPTGKSIVEAINRFLLQGWDWALDPKVGSDQDRAAVGLAMKKLFAREEVYAKFASQRRWGLIRGDAMWHLVANSAKAESTRISIYELDPASYFPIEDPNDPAKIIGCHLVDQMMDDEKKTIVRRHTYRKQDDGTIFTQLAFFELAGWDDRFGSLQVIKPTTPPSAVRSGQAELLAGFVLPARITSLPVYHVKSGREPAAPFGTSVMAGIETVLTGIVQAVSDTDLALALDGIGMFVTTSSPPIDDQGNELPWRIKPGGVIEIDDESTWTRVTGVNGLPGLQLADWLVKAAHAGAGVPDIATGHVDVATAESGVALAFKMAPILKANEEREVAALGVLDHMLYDLTHAWLPEFEGTPDTVDCVSIVQDPMPINRVDRVKELTSLVASGFISLAYGREELGKLGYEFPATMATDVITEQTAINSARMMADPFVNRANAEAEGLQAP